MSEIAFQQARTNVLCVHAYVCVSVTWILLQKARLWLKFEFLMSCLNLVMMLLLDLKPEMTISGDMMSFLVMSPPHKFLTLMHCVIH